MKRKALFLLAIASVVMLALPTKAWADGMNEAQKESPIKKKIKGVTARWLPYFILTHNPSRLAEELDYRPHLCSRELLGVLLVAYVLHRLPHAAGVVHLAAKEAQR